MTELESKELLKHAGLAVTETMLSKSKEEAISISRELGFPVVLKIVSPDIIHKSDAGGVELGIESAEQLSQAYDRIIVAITRRYAQALIDGISMQRQARPGVEVIIGMTKDPQFGPAIMFGLGGVWAGSPQPGYACGERDCAPSDGVN